MNWTPEERKAIEESYDHWDKDMVIPISREGASRFAGHYPCGGADCALCKISSDVYCNQCPYLRFYGKTCGSSGMHWYNWKRNPSPETAIAMRDALKKLLE